MSTIFNRDHEPPQPSDADVALGIAKAAIVTAATLAVPPLGAAIAGGSAVLQQVFRTPLERRTAEWQQEITEAVRKLEEKLGISPEDLSNNPFIDAALKAYQAFVQTSRREKRKALMNAVINAALTKDSGVARQEMFWSLLVERFSAIHLALLALLHSPSNWRGPDGQRLPFITSGQASVIVLAAFEDAQQNRPLYEQAWSDLFNAGLVTTSKIDNGPEGDLMAICRTTDLGKEFLKFITSPIPE